MAQSLGANVLRGYSERFYWRVEEEEVIPWDKHEMDQMTGELQALGLKENWYQLCQNRTEWND